MRILYLCGGEGSPEVLHEDKGRLRCLICRALYLGGGEGSREVLHEDKGRLRRLICRALYLCGGEGSREVLHEDKGCLRRLVYRALFPAVHTDSLARHFGLTIIPLGGRNDNLSSGQAGTCKNRIIN